MGCEESTVILENQVINIEHFVNNDFDSSNLTQILNGIQDVLLVYSPDKKIIFMNKKGEELVNLSGHEVKGKSCQIFCGTNVLCGKCPLSESITKKKLVIKERYFNNYQKHLFATYNPVLDEEGCLQYVVAQMSDRTETENLQNSLRESKKQYINILDTIPDPVVIFQNDKIAYANATSELIENNLIGRRLEDLAIVEKDIMLYRSFQTLKEKSQGSSFDYNYHAKDGRKLNLETTTRYIEYNNQPAILAIVRDITEKKQGLINAARIQKRFLPKEFPIEARAGLKVLYQPAKTVSGDFYAFEKINEDLVIGLLGDVTGKGVTAAMNISAFNVLFKEAVERSQDPMEIVDIMNKKSVKYFGERYTAVCCFSLDFKSKKAHIVGAGISNCIHIKSNQSWKEHILRGPFLGMFDAPQFDSVGIDLSKGDELIFYSDGLDDYLRGDAILEAYGNSLTSEGLHEYLEHQLEYLTSHIKGLSDDCTMLSLKIR